MEFQVLGSIRILRDGENVMGPGRIMRTLVAVLLSRADEPVPVDALVDAAWPDHAGSDPSNRLHVVVSRLRGILGDPDRLVLEHGAYRLRVATGELDAERFESLVDEATDHADDPDGCAELARKALDLWRGSPYSDLDVPMLSDESERLIDRRLSVLELLWEAELARGRHSAAIGELTDLSRRHPFRERFHALLMTALYRSGRQTAALEVYQSARATYVEELGLDPGPELRDLEQQILNGEPIALGATTTTAETPKPAQLPTQPGGFVGRDDEVAELDRVLLEEAGPTPIAVISGTAGVGKTALAIRWAHHARHHFPDGQFYVDLHGYDPDQPIAAMAVLAGFSARSASTASRSRPIRPSWRPSSARWSRIGGCWLSWTTPTPSTRYARCCLAPPRSRSSSPAATSSRISPSARAPTGSTSTGCRRLTRTTCSAPSSAAGSTPSPTPSRT